MLVYLVGVLTSKKQKTGGRWNFEEANHHINYLELLAIYYGLKSSCKGCLHMHIQVKTDSICARSYINSMGGVKSPECNEIAKEIWLWCIDRSIWISAEHIPGSQNDADFSNLAITKRIQSVNLILR